MNLHPPWQLKKVLWPSAAGVKSMLSAQDLIMRADDLTSVCSQFQLVSYIQVRAVTWNEWGLTTAPAVSGLKHFELWDSDEACWGVSSLS